MPALDPPLDQSGRQVSFTLVPRNPLRLMSNINIAAAALIFIFALCLVFRYRNKITFGLRVVDQADKGIFISQHLSSIDRKKSRGVSNAIVMDMSANHHPIPASFKPEVGLDPTVDVGNATQGGKNATGSPADRFTVYTADMGVTQHLRARPPLPLPLTPPMLATNLIYGERRLSSALSATGSLNSSFFDQPNPDYISSLESSPSSSQPNNSPIIPRTRSYTKTLPLGPPQPVSWLEDDGRVVDFSPSSFPSTSPILPLAPHESFHTHESIDVKGEIISALDGSGAGWKRHTRVYGGGACLACMASPDREGGFYGARVRPEEKR